MEEASPSEESRSESKRVGMHITSDPDQTEIEQPKTFGAREVPSLPFRILLVSDLMPQASSLDWEAGSHVHRVDKNTFAEFMAERTPRLTVEVPNVISDAPKTWTLDLSFAELEAFRPEQVARQVEPTAQLMEVAELVQAVGAGEIDLETFRARLDEVGIDMDWVGDLYRTLAEEDAPDESGASTGSAESDTDDSLDRLMGMVDMGEDDEPSEPRAPAASTNGDVGSSDFMGALMEAVSDDAPGAGVDSSAADLLLGRLQEALSEQVRSILQHAEFRKLEAAWYGLKFMVDRLDFRENVELVVLPAGRGDLHEAMHHQVIVPEHSDNRDEPSVSLILVDQAFGRNHLDIEQLADLAGTGESLQTPVVTSVRPGFFGIEKMSGLAKLPALRPHLQGDEYVEWKALREEDKAQFLGLTLPSFLLRYPYDGENSGTYLAIQEDEGLRGSGALAVGVAAAQSFVESGWPTHLEEYPIEDLPVQKVRGGQSPLAALLPGSKQSELARAGFIVLGARPDHDAIRVVHAPMVRRPDTYDDPDASAEARAHASLPCRLFVARAAHYLLLLKAGIEPGPSIDALREEITAAMASFLGVSVPEEPGADGEDEEAEERAISVEHVTNVNLPDHELLAIRLRPPKPVLSPRVQLVMGVQVPTST